MATKGSKTCLKGGPGRTAIIYLLARQALQPTCRPCLCPFQVGQVYLEVEGHSPASVCCACCLHLLCELSVSVLCGKFLSLCGIICLPGPISAYIQYTPRNGWALQAKSDTEVKPSSISGCGTSCRVEPRGTLAGSVPSA